MRGNINKNDEILLGFKQGRLEPYYRYVYPGLLLYAGKLLGGHNEMSAEDFVQEVSLTAWERRDTFDSISAFKSFLYISVRNTIISQHRKFAVHSRYMTNVENQTPPVIEIIDNEARTILFNAIAELPGKMRTVFELNFIEGLKIAEIAKRMDLTESSIKKYKSHGLDILRQKLDPSLFIALLIGTY